MRHVIVTKEDIKNGVPRSGRSCPIALALRRKVEPTEGAVMVSSTVATIGTSNYRLPYEATNFVINFDSGKPVQPFEFDLRPL